MTARENSVPMCCDRCGLAVESGRHHRFSFDVYSDVRDTPPPTLAARFVPGRLCNACEPIVSDALCAFAKSMGLTTTRRPGSRDEETISIGYNYSHKKNSSDLQ